MFSNWCFWVIGSILDVYVVITFGIKSMKSKT